MRFVRPIWEVSFWISTRLRLEAKDGGGLQKLYIFYEFLLHFGGLWASLLKLGALSLVSRGTEPPFWENGEFRPSHFGSPLAASWRQSGSKARFLRP